MLVKKFLVFFAWFHLAYTVSLLLLLFEFTRYDGRVWFLLLQSTFTAVVLAVWKLFPSFVEKGAPLPLFRAIRPLVFVLEGIHVFMLGLLWEYYRNIGATFKVFFPSMMFFKCIELAALAMVQQRPKL